MRVAVLLFSAIVLLAGSGCHKPDKPRAIITIVDPDQHYVQGARVTVYSSPNGSTIHDSQTSNDAGQVMFEYQEEVILNVKAEIDRDNVHLDGNGLIILKQDETYYETIMVK